MLTDNESLGAVLPQAGSAQRVTLFFFLEAGVWALTPHSVQEQIISGVGTREDEDRDVIIYARLWARALADSQIRAHARRHTPSVADVSSSWQH